MSEIPLRRLARVQYGLGQPPPLADGGVPIIRATNIERGRIVPKGLIYAARDDLPLDRAPLLRAGEILVVRSGAYTTDSALVTLEWEGAAPGYDLRVTPGRRSEPRFLAYSLLGRRSLEAMWVASSRAAQPHLNAEELGEVPITDLPLSQQEGIADFLDTETARIDALITKKRRLIDLLSQRLDSTIDSEICSDSWIPLKRLVRYREGPGIMAHDFREEGVPLVRLAGVGGPTVTLSGCNFLDPGVVATKWNHFRLLPGDYLISASASMGIVSLVDGEAAGAIPYTGLIIFRPASVEVSMEYVRFFLGSREFMRQIDLMKTGTAIQRFGPTHLDQVVIPRMSLADQQRSVNAMVAAENHQRELTTRISNQINLLVEHRRALITAAVTGDLEIPGVAA